MEIRVIDEGVEVPTLQPERCEISPAVTVGGGIVPQWWCAYWSQLIP